MSGSDTVPTSEVVSGSAMDAQQNLPPVPSDIKFRVLIIGRANAGKTSILQRVCDTTDSPEIYSVDSEGVRTRVRSRSF
jgi:septin family protein